MSPTGKVSDSLPPAWSRTSALARPTAQCDLMAPARQSMARARPFPLPPHAGCSRGVPDAAQL
eukprot:7565534-Pyramimonas_sp.AAC.1